MCKPSGPSEKKSCSHWVSGVTCKLLSSEIQKEQKKMKNFLKSRQVSVSICERYFTFIDPFIYTVYCGTDWSWVKAWSAQWSKQKARLPVAPQEKGSSSWRSSSSPSLGPSPALLFLNKETESREISRGSCASDVERSI